MNMKVHCSGRLDRVDEVKGHSNIMGKSYNKSSRRVQVKNNPCSGMEILGRELTFTTKTSGHKVILVWKKSDEKRCRCKQTPFLLIKNCKN